MVRFGLVELNRWWVWKGKGMGWVWVWVIISN